MKKLLKSRKFWKRLILGVVVIPLLLFSILISVLYWKQDSVVQELIHNMNEDFAGLIVIEDSHISPFETFPYISIDLEKVKIYEDKTKSTTPLVDVTDVFLGFDLWTIISGKMEVKDIKLKNGSLNLVQHIDGEFNITKALTSSNEVEIEDANEEFHLDLKEIELENIDLTKLNEENNLLVDALIYEADAKFTTSPHHIYTKLDSKFELNLIKDGDTTFIKHKHFDVNTSFDLFDETNILTIKPTVVKLEGSEFNMEGTIDVLHDMLLDLKFSGNKKDFSLVMAMAPDELVPTLKKYDNKGKIFFDATIKGKSINHNNPAIEATFKCEDAYFNNTDVKKKLDQLNFVGHFTNGEKRDPSTMEFTLNNFTARPEVGIVKADLSVKNFNKPDINLKLNTDFKLEFLAKFFNLNNLIDMDGKIELLMNFHDIIDFDNPEVAIEKLNESYYTQLKVEDLSFMIDNGKEVPIKDVDLFVKVEGHQATIDYFNLLVGNSDLSLKGTISDLPAVIHHTNIPVDTRLSIKSKFLDIFELTGSDSTKSFDEQIENLSLDLDFKSSAKALTESPNLPVGEFFIENLYGKLKHYPHALHDFHADVLIDSQDMRLIDFTGMIDESDFHFSGKLTHYDMWLLDHPRGDTKVEFDLTSNQLRLEDLFSYKGENYVPEDYRHEEFKELKLHGYTDLHFNEGLQSTDLRLDKFESKMKVHKMKFERFNGRIHYEKDHLVVEDLSGKVGRSDFKTTLHYYLGENEAEKKRSNHFSIVSNQLDLDQLLDYHIPENPNEKTNHDSVFNIYSLPFTDMTYDIDIKRLNYHTYLIFNMLGKLRTTPKHYLYVDQFNLDAAGGSFDIKGYFNGSNPNLIYFSPDMKVKDVNLDKFLLKFDNFGQDHLVSENLHGNFSGTITGKIHMHTDLTPKIDDSELHMDVHVTNGRLENFEMFEAMSDYFADKNLKSVRFDTLDNHFDMVNGELTIPNMDINSSVGHMLISGKQNTDLTFEYYISVPWKVVTQAASSKLFKRKKEEVDATQVDEIQYANENKKTRYINIKINGNPDDYKISLGKRKK